MKKKVTRVLSLMMVVALIAALPASTQIMAGDSADNTEATNLPMLIAVNRLELSEEQTEDLHDILSGILEEKAGLEQERSAFEDEMIAFDGTSEELDELLASYREKQAEQAEAVRESIQEALHEVGDLLTINQGLVLREELPQLLSAITGGDKGMQERMLQRGGSMQMLPTGRGQMMGAGAMRQMGHSQITMRMGAGRRMNDVPQMSDQRGDYLEQHSEGFEDGAMMGQRRERIHMMDDESLDDETLRERLGERVGGVIEGLRERFGQQMEGNGQELGGRAGGRGMMPFGERDAMGGCSEMSDDGMMLRLQMTPRGGMTRQGQPLEFVEQLVEILELKLEAMT